MAQLTLAEFGDTIKAKYPAYADRDSAELGAAMINKYPQYADRVQMPSQRQSFGESMGESFRQFTQPARQVMGGLAGSLGSFVPRTVGAVVSGGEKIGEAVGRLESKLPGGIQPQTPKALKGLGGKVIEKAGQAEKSIQRGFGKDVEGKGLTQAGKFVGDVGQAVVGGPKLPMSIPALKGSAPLLGKLGLRGLVEGARYSVGTEGKVDPVEMGVSAVAEAAIPLAGLGLKAAKKGIGKAAKGLEESAGVSVQKALKPTKKKMKQLTKKITPEFLKKGIWGSRESMFKMAKENAEKFGSQIDDAVEKGRLDNVTIPRNEVDKLLHEAKLSTTVAGKVVNDTKYQVVSKLEDIIQQFPQEIGGKEARAIKQILDDIVYATKGGIWAEDLTYKNKLVKNMADTLRKELAQASPDLAKLNKEFSFYKTLEDILGETIERMKPQSGGLRKGVSAIVGGQQQGMFEKVIGYIGTKAFLDATSSATWNTISAQLKYKLANALASGSGPAINKVVNEINTKHNTQLPLFDNQ